MAPPWTFGNRYDSRWGIRRFTGPGNRRDRDQESRGGQRTSSIVETMSESQGRLVCPHAMRRRVVFATFLIFAMCLVQAFCHSEPSRASFAPRPQPAVHSASQHPGQGAAGAGVTEHSEHIEAACSGDPADSSCTGTTLTSCLLVLFLAAGMSVPHKDRPARGHVRFTLTAPLPLRSAETAPDLHALGISRT